MLSRDKKNVKFALVLLSVVGGMLGLSFASVPLYQLFCKVTGYGGTLNTEGVVASRKISERTIKVHFDSNISPKLKWLFKPQQNEVTVKLGEQRLAFYEAENISKKALTGHAVFNVTPFKAAQYFSKIDCFCFTEQTLDAGQVVPMPVQFYIDPEIVTDPNTKEITTITLSYTFYPSEIESIYDKKKLNLSLRVKVPYNG
jgi:cytochrome c oxidase assembly protein subunit 11